MYSVYIYLHVQTKMQSVSIFNVLHWNFSLGLLIIQSLFTGLHKCRELLTGNPFLGKKKRRPLLVVELFTYFFYYINFVIKANIAALQQKYICISINIVINKQKMHNEYIQPWADLSNRLRSKTLLKLRRPWQSEAQAAKTLQVYIYSIRLSSSFTQASSGQLRHIA